MTVCCLVQEIVFAAIGKKAVKSKRGLDLRWYARPRQLAEIARVKYGQKVAFVIEHDDQ